MALSTHVDDLKGASSDADARALLAYLEKAVGNCSQDWKKFQHTGIEHEQTDSGVFAHQFTYAEQLKPMDVSSLKGSPDDDSAPGDYPSKYMSLLGGIAWMVLTRVDIAVYVQALQRRAHSPRVKDCKRLNTVVRYVKRKKIGIKYGPLPPGDANLTVFSDAAFKAIPDESSGLALRGCVILLCTSGPEELINPSGTCHMLEYVCRRQRRVVRSTYSAELNGLVDSVEVTRLVRILFHQILHGTDQESFDMARAQDEGKLRPHIKAATDAKAVFDSVAAPDICDPAESSLKLHLLALRDFVTHGIIESLFWTDTRDMLADGLTKGSVDRAALRTVSGEGRYRPAHVTQCHPK